MLSEIIISTKKSEQWRPPTNRQPLGLEWYSSPKAVMAFQAILLKSYGHVIAKYILTGGYFFRLSQFRGWQRRDDAIALANERLDGNRVGEAAFGNLVLFIALCLTSASGFSHNLPGTDRNSGAGNRLHCVWWALVGVIECSFCGDPVVCPYPSRYWGGSQGCH